MFSRSVAVGRLLLGCRLRTGDGSRSAHRTWGFNFSALFVVPGGLVVSYCGGVETREQAILRKLESIFNNESRVGVVDEIVSGNAIVLNGVIDQSAKEGNVCAGANLQKEIRHRRSAREARIDDEHFRI